MNSKCYLSLNPNLIYRKFMKRALTTNLMFLLLFSNLSFGQSYQFDKIVKNNFPTEFHPNQRLTHLFNSKDYSYQMQIYNQGDSLKSRLFDTKNNQIHSFYLEQSDSLSFYYLSTYNYKEQIHSYTYEFSEVNTSKNKKNIDLTIFNKNKKVANYKLEIEESSLNLFPIFNLTAMESFHMMKIGPPSNFTVIKAKGTNISGKNVKYELISIEVTNLEIDLPEILTSE